MIVDCRDDPAFERPEAFLDALDAAIGTSPEKEFPGQCMPVGGDWLVIGPPRLSRTRAPTTSDLVRSWTSRAAALTAIHRANTCVLPPVGRPPALTDMQPMRQRRCVAGSAAIDGRDVSSASCPQGSAVAAGIESVMT